MLLVLRGVGAVGIAAAAAAAGGVGVAAVFDVAVVCWC